METTEQKAIDTGNNRARLLKRLMDAKSVLLKQYRQEFSPYTFDFEHKRLISRTGAYFLQWQIRCYPDMPISYENQQTSIGNVYLIKVHGKV